MFYENVSELFLINVRRYPWKTAVVFRDKRYTYQQLNQRINRIANGLLSLGVRAGDKVAFLFPNSSEIVELYYAIQKIGAIAVPLNFRLIPREIAFLINSSDTGTLFFSAEFAGKVSAVRTQLNKVGAFISSEKTDEFPFTLEALMERGGTQEPPLFRDSKAISRIQFTGGSTGVPKGVMRTHEADITEIIGIMMSNKMCASPDQVILIQCPLEHHGGHSWFTCTFSSGGTLIICEAFSAEQVLSLIEKERVTYMLLLPPSTYLRLFECPDLHKYDLSSVLLVQSSAGCTTPEIIRRIYEVFPNSIANYGWGQTESGLGISLVLTREMAEQRLPRIQSIGRPMHFFEVKVVDDDGNELPNGQVGEAMVKSPAVMAGYYGQPELTAEVLGEDAWLRTGDMMRMDDEGYLYMLSRKKDMIKSGGENVFAQEVEGTVKEHPAVAECIVIPVPDEIFGEAVMAVVQLRSGLTLTLDELQEHCKSRLSSYKKPRYLEFVGQFGMNDAGKIRRNELSEQYQSQRRAAMKAQRKNK